MMDSLIDTGSSATQLTMIALTLRRQGVRDKHATDVVKWKKIRGRTFQYDSGTSNRET